ncbi:hypothetical protein Dimus_027042, partial [Dionaea muscipula]
MKCSQPQGPTTKENIHTHVWRPKQRQKNTLWKRVVKDGMPRGNAAGPPLEVHNNIQDDHASVHTSVAMQEIHGNTSGICSSSAIPEIDPCPAMLPMATSSNDQPGLKQVGNDDEGFQRVLNK